MNKIDENHRILRYLHKWTDELPQILNDSHSYVAMKSNTNNHLNLSPILGYLFLLSHKFIQFLSK